MHSDASDPSFNMLVDLIRSANDFCFVLRICDNLGAIHEDDLESHQMRLQLVLLQESRIPPLCLELLQLTISQVTLGLQR